jgi:outer membrane protein assembly factor BamE (lipoprotein component of BamABCDE complex)
VQKSRMVASLLAVLFFTGCAMQGGKEFDTGYVSRIERGTTTKADVRANLGEPVSRSTAGNGEEVWHYAYQKGPNHFQSVVGAYTGKVPMSGKSLMITFSGDLVKDYTYSESGN